MAHIDSTNVTRWVDELKQGDIAAAEKIWSRYCQELAAVARRRLSGLPLRMADEEDVVSEAFAAFLRGITKEQFFQLNNRTDLWQALVRFVDCSAKDCRRRQTAQKRGSGLVRGESVFDHPCQDSSAPGLARMADVDSLPESAEAMVRLLELRLGELNDPRLREIALLKLEGYTTDEIADRLQISRRSVERKAQIIRSIWEHGDEPSS